MARMVSLQNLMDRARRAADLENITSFVSDAEVIEKINAAIPELHDLLVQAYGEDYFHFTANGTFVANKQPYPLPEDFYKLIGVDVESNVGSGDYIPLLRFNERERTMGQGQSMGLTEDMRYRLRGDYLYFAPPPDSARNYIVHYVAPAPVLIKKTFTDADVTPASDTIDLEDHGLYTQHPVRVSVESTGTLLGGISANTTYYAIRVDANTIKLATTAENARDGTAIDLTSAGSGTHTILSMFDGVNGWEELAVLTAAIAMADKEESDTRAKERERERLSARLNAMVENRDQGEPETIQDVEGNLPGEDYYTRWPPTL